MNLIRTDDYNCVLASFAMAMDVPMDELREQLGHDGKQVVAGCEPVPACYRSYHPQELIDVLMRRGYACTMVELEPLMQHGVCMLNHAAFLGRDRFFQALLNGDGVIFGQIETSRTGHAVAWNSGESTIYDPRGYTYQWNEGQDFKPRQFFLIQKVE
jgi:hypothetical protein